ncbi:uncharacterized protein [Onthophagus taurus]|uniref:uncharacterized protein n=1 Tax=Onthophagus taurus TaxID=166361 RepID=UPI000C20D20E|nr:uncharacterized protein LOC111427505 [Onthophagus taurus]
MARRQFVFVLVLASVLAVGFCDEDQQPKGERENYKRSLDKECASSYSITCFKLDVVNWVEKLNNQEDLNVLPGVSLVRESRAKANEEIVAEVAREFPNDPDARLDAFLMNKVSNYLGTHSIKLNLFDPNTARKGDGIGGGGKKGGGMGMLLAAGAMMKGTLMAVAMAALAALAGKALMTALISLMLSAIIGLKSLTSGGGKQTTYEVITKPIYSHGSSHSSSHEDYGGHGHSSYGRSFDMPLPLGLQPDYQPYKP